MALGAGPTPGRRAFVIACLVGGALAVIGFVVILHTAPGGFFRRETFANFYDAQADAWLHGRWDVPAPDLYIEGFLIGTKTYTYFGAWPSLLRMPVLAVSGGAYGHLTALSMTLAFATALTGVGALQWRLRELFRPGRPFGRGELVLAGAVVFVAGCGTSLLFLASRAWVYHEAILWGAAWAIVAYERIIAFMMRPSRARLLGAATFGGLAFLSRASVGMGPIVALGLVLVGRLLREVHRRSAARRAPTDGTVSAAPPTGAAPGRSIWTRLDWLGGADDGRSWLGPLLLAVIVPATAYGFVNSMRFGTLFSVPWSRQVLALIDAHHKQYLAANHGTYFGLRFIPTTLWQYLRPDALAFDAHFPWIAFPRFATHIFNGVNFDTIDPSTSVVASMPALSLLGVFGVLAAVMPSFGRTPRAAGLRVPLVGALAGIGLTVAIAYVAQRYLGDWVPLMVLGALIGLQALLRRGEEARLRRSTQRWIVVVAVLAVFGIWVNGGLAVLYARLYAPEHDTDRLAMLEVQHDLDVGGPHSLGHSAALPSRPARAGTTWIVGDCSSMYWSDGRAWYPVQGRAAGGWFRLLVHPANLSTDWQPLVIDDGPRTGLAVGIRRNDTGPNAGTVQVGIGTEKPRRARHHGESPSSPRADQPAARRRLHWPSHAKTIPIGSGPLRINVVMDDALGYVRMSVNGTSGVQTRDSRLPIHAGPFTISPKAHRLADSIGLCRDLIGDSKQH